MVEVRDFDKYIVKVDGSGRLTLRNRRYLKKLYEDSGMFAPLHTARENPVVEQTSTIPETTVPILSKRMKKNQVPRTPVQSDHVLQNDRLHTSVNQERLVPNRVHLPSSGMRQEQLNPVLSTAFPAHRMANNTPEPQTLDQIDHDSPQKNMSPTRKELFPKTVPVTGRPMRNKKQRLFYDAEKGIYVGGNPGDDID